MPKMGGFDATQAIRQREAATGSRVPIVALTAHAMQGDRERCLAAGMDGYLPKPIDVDELIATVEQLARGAKPTRRRGRRPSDPRRRSSTSARRSLTPAAIARCCGRWSRCFAPTAPRRFGASRRALDSAGRRGASSRGTLAQGRDRDDRLSRRPAGGRRARARRPRSAVRRRGPHVSRRWSNGSRASTRRWRRSSRDTTSTSGSAREKT